MIQSVSIQDFKCFEQQSISLGELTLLAGANSVGKSSVIQALLLNRMVIEYFYKTEIWENLENGQSYGPVSVSFSLNGPFLLNLGSSSEVLNMNAPSGILSFTISQGDNCLELSFNVPQEEDSYSLLLSGITRSGVISDLSLIKIPFYYLNAERIGPRIRHEVDDLRYLHAGWQGEYAVQVIGDNKLRPVEDSRCFDSEQAPGLLHQSRLWLDSIAPGTELTDASLVNGIKSAFINLNGRKPTNAGFGISYVLPIIVNGLIAEKGSMFIVENPEAHLHPSGQSQIGKFLAKIAASGVQVVLETHSEHVINGIRISALTNVINPQNVIINFFNWDSTHSKVQVTPICVNDAGDLTSYPKGFFDQEQRDIAEIIRAKRKKMEPKS